MLDASGESVIVQASIVAGFAALALTALFLTSALALRRVVMARHRHVLSVERTWQPLMLRALREDPPAAPPLARRDVVQVLGLWNRLVATITGDGVDRLRAFARAAGLPDAARHVMRSRRVSDRLVAAVFLGRDRDVRGLRALRELASSGDVVVRAEAARAMVRMDPNAGPRAAAPLIAQWDDLHPAVAVAVMADAPPAAAAEAVAAQAVSAADPVRQARLVEVLEVIRAPVGLAAVRQILDGAPAPEVVARGLEVIRAFRRPEDAERVRRYLEHPEPFVRVEAVAALGRIMGPGDEWRLVSVLDDPDWWVRRRAAEALAESTRMPAPLLRHLAAVHPDRYARGALAHVLSEREARG